MMYSDFLTQVRYALEEPTANVWADARILELTNRAIRDIQSKVGTTRDEVYADTVVGQQSYDLPDHTLVIENVLYEGRPLMRMSVSGLHALVYSSDVSGTPNAFAVGDDTLYLYPTPSAVGSIHIFRTRSSDELTATTDLMPFGDAHNDLIELYVLAKCFEQTNDWQTAGEYMNRYQNELAAAESAQDALDAGYSSEPVQTY